MTRSSIIVPSDQVPFPQPDALHGYRASQPGGSDRTLSACRVTYSIRSLTQPAGLIVEVPGGLSCVGAETRLTIEIGAEDRQERELCSEPKGGF